MDKSELILQELKTLKKISSSIEYRLAALMSEEYGVKEVASELRLSESAVYKIPKEILRFDKQGKFRVYKKGTVLDYKAAITKAA